MELTRTAAYVIRHKHSRKYYNGNSLETWADDPLYATRQNENEPLDGWIDAYIKTIGKNPVRPRSKELIGAENLEAVHIRITVEEIS